MNRWGGPWNKNYKCRLSADWLRRPGNQLLLLEEMRKLRLSNWPRSYKGQVAGQALGHRAHTGSSASVWWTNVRTHSQDKLPTSSTYNNALLQNVTFQKFNVSPNFALWNSKNLIHSSPWYLNSFFYSFNQDYWLYQISNAMLRTQWWENKDILSAHMYLLGSRWRAIIIQQWNYHSAT